MGLFDFITCASFQRVLEVLQAEGRLGDDEEDEERK